MSAVASVRVVAIIASGIPLWGQSKRGFFTEPDGMESGAWRSGSSSLDCATQSICAIFGIDVRHASVAALTPTLTSVGGCYLEALPIIDGLSFADRDLLLSFVEKDCSAATVEVVFGILDKVQIDLVCADGRHCYSTHFR